MVSIKWCAAQKHGIMLIAPNSHMADSYLHMAEESLSVLQVITESRIWIATTAYYIFYYSLYALMLRIGVKCEIHACSLEFMKQYLAKLYTQEDAEMIAQAFSARIDLQYYTDRAVDEVIIAAVKRYCKIFFIKTKDLHAKITEKQVQEIRNALQGGMR